MSIAACLKIPSIEINTDFSQFLPDNDPEYIFYENLKPEIKNDESIIIIAIKNNPSVFDHIFLENTQIFLDSLRKLDGVKKIRSLTDLKYPVKSLFGVIGFPYLEITDSVDVSRYKQKIRKDRHITQHFINKEETALFVWLELNDLYSPDQVEETLLSIERLKKNTSALETYMWGKQYLQKQLNEITKSSTKSIVIWVLLFLVAILTIIFKHYSR